MQVLESRELTYADEKSYIQSILEYLFAPFQEESGHQGEGSPLALSGPLEGPGEEDLREVNALVNDLLAAKRALDDRRLLLVLAFPGDAVRCLAEVQRRGEPYGWSSSDVSRMLHELVEAGELYLFKNEKVKGSLGRPQYLYSRKNRTEAEWEEAARPFTDSHIPPKALGGAGERYVRAILVKSKCFANITQIKRLGNVPVCGRKPSYRRDPLDLTFCLRNDPDTIFIVEVKNTQERYESGAKDVFKDLIARTIDYGDAHKRLAVPVLVSVLLDSQAEAHAESLGIATWQLGRQMIPKDYESAALGRTFFGRLRCNELINLKRTIPRDSGLTAGMRQDLAFVSKPAWLLSAKAVWLKTQSLCRRSLNEHQRLPRLDELRDHLRGPVGSLIRVPFVPMHILSNHQGVVSDYARAS